MKKLALVNTYCNNWKKLDILYSTLEKLESLEIDSLVYSPIPLPQEIISKATYTFFTKENPILDPVERSMIHFLSAGDFTNILTFPDYGWASIYQYKKLMEVGSKYDYDYYFPLIYDLNIDNQVEEILLNPHDKLFFPSKKGGIIEVGGIFMSFNKENLSKLHPIINKTDYLRVTDQNIAETYIKYWCTEIKGEISSHVTTDKIDEHNKPKFNILTEDFPFSLMVHPSKLKFVFYDMKSKSEDITINLNGLFYDFNISSSNPKIEFNNIKEVKKLILYYNQTPIDLIKYFNNSEPFKRSIEEK